MKKQGLLIVLLGFVFNLVAQQEKTSITGDWLQLYKDNNGVLKIIQKITLEPYEGNNYVAAYQAVEYPLELYKALYKEYNGNQYLAFKKLNDKYALWHAMRLKRVEQDSAVVEHYLGLPVDIGKENRFSITGDLLGLDSSALTFPLEYNQSDFVYDDTVKIWKQDTAFRKVASFSRNLALFDYCIAEYGNQLNNRAYRQVYYRWDYLTWDKVNRLKSNRVRRIWRLNRHAVAAFFEIKSIKELEQFKEEEFEGSKSSFSLNDYHQIPAYSVYLNKVPAYYLMEFDDGTIIKVKTGRLHKHLYDVTNQRWYTKIKKD